MEKKKVTRLFGFLFLVIVIFLPGYSKYQELAQRNKALEERLRELRMANERFKKELVSLQQDHTYIEKVAREKLKVTKKGEIVYKIVEEDKNGGQASGE